MSGADEPHHQPLRLSTVAHAPVDRLNDVLADNEAVADLLDNDWLSVTAVDPTQGHRAFHYERDLAWTPAADAAKAPPAEPSAPEIADE